MTEISAADVAQFKSSARIAFSGRRGTEDVRKEMATEHGWDVAVWQRVSRQLEPAGLMLNPDHGGSGLGAAEMAYVMEEAGATLFCAPLFATAVLAVPLLIALGDETALGAYGPRISSGELTATVAMAGDKGAWSLTSLPTSARLTDGGWHLDGVNNYVVDGHTAGLVLVIAQTPDGPATFAVAGDAAGLTRESLVTLDQTRKMARLAFIGTPGSLIGSVGDIGSISRASDVSRALLAAEQTGGAQQCLDMAVEYAKTRIQFGRPIGSFQAVKQRLADMLIQVESSRSAAYAAARAAAGDDPDLSSIVRVAAITATHAFNYVSAQNIQLHGGIGFTWEHDAHLYFKRAHTSALLLGTEDEHLAVLATMLEKELT